MTIQVDEHGEVTADIDEKDAHLLKEFRDLHPIFPDGQAGLSMDDTWSRIERLSEQGLMSMELDDSRNRVNVQTTPSGLRFRARWLRDAPKRAKAQAAAVKAEADRRQGYIDEALF